MLPLLQLQYLFISFSIHPYLYLYRVCRAPFPQSKKLSESVINKTAQQQQSEAGSRAGSPSQLGCRTQHTTSARVGKPQNILPVVLCNPVNIRHQEGDKGHNSIAKPSMGTGCCVVVSERMCYGWVERKKWKPGVGQQQQSEVWLRSLFTTATAAEGTKACYPIQW